MCTPFRPHYSGLFLSYFFISPFLESFSLDGLVRLGLILEHVSGGGRGAAAPGLQRCHARWLLRRWPLAALPHFIREEHSGEPRRLYFPPRPFAHCDVFPFAGRQVCNAVGAGLLVGTALAVIIPEGMHSLYNGMARAVRCCKRGRWVSLNTIVLPPQLRHLMEKRTRNMSTNMYVGWYTLVRASRAHNLVIIDVF